MRTVQYHRLAREQCSGSVRLYCHSNRIFAIIFVSLLVLAEDTETAEDILVSD